jgi:hypothetical protein
LRTIAHHNHFTEYNVTLNAPPIFASVKVHVLGPLANQAVPLRFAVVWPLKLDTFDEVMFTNCSAPYELNVALSV